MSVVPDGKSPNGDEPAPETERGPATETGIVVRPADESDVEALVPLQQELLDLQRKLRPVYYHPVPSFAEHSRAYFAESLCSPEWAAFVAEEAGGPIVGYASVILHHRPELFGGGLEAHIDDLYVSESHRHRGVGEALIETAGVWATAMSAERLTLWVETNNDPALAFYAHTGFQEYERFLALELQVPDKGADDEPVL